VKEEKATRTEEAQPPLAAANCSKTTNQALLPSQRGTIIILPRSELASPPRMLRKKTVRPPPAAHVHPPDRPCKALGLLFPLWPPSTAPATAAPPTVPSHRSGHRDQPRRNFFFFFFSGDALTGPPQRDRPGAGQPASPSSPMVQTPPRWAYQALSQLVERYGLRGGLFPMAPSRGKSLAQPLGSRLTLLNRLPGFGSPR